MSRTLFLPGASGRRDYWACVAQKVGPRFEPELLGWPGFGSEPPDERIRSLTDLADYVLGHVSAPVDLVAQSMGGVVALMVALREPDAVGRMVLAGTSGGVDLARFGADDWRSGYVKDLPEQAPRWFVDDRTDFGGRISEVTARVLLLWGEDDRISPPPVGRYLCSLLPNARFALIPNAGHMAADDQPELVASEIRSFLEAS